MRAANALNQGIYSKRHVEIVLYSHSSLLSSSFSFFFIFSLVKKDFPTQQDLHPMCYNYVRTPTPSASPSFPFHKHPSYFSILLYPPSSLPSFLFIYLFVYLFLQRCVGSLEAPRLEVQVATTWFSCPFGGRLKNIKGFSGSLSCPDTSFCNGIHLSLSFIISSLLLLLSPRFFVMLWNVVASLSLSAVLILFISFFFFLLFLFFLFFSLSSSPSLLLLFSFSSPSLLLLFALTGNKRRHPMSLCEVLLPLSSTFFFFLIPYSIIFFSFYFFYLFII